MNPRRSLLTTPLLKWGVTLCFLGLVLLTVDIAGLWRELSSLPLSLLLPVLMLTVLQVFMSAWRWRYTVSRLGIELPFGIAVREYYLASFLNQVLPGGVLGDVNRAWRHGSVISKPVPAIHGVLIERLSGQFALAIVVAIALVWLVSTSSFSLGVHWVVWGFAVLFVGSCVGGWYLVCQSRRLREQLRQLRNDVYRTLLSWPALPIQVVTSLMVLGSYLGVFLLLALGAGYLTGWGSVFLHTALCSLLLLSMVVPVTVAGWGVREGAAAVLWPLAGLPPEQGIALSIGYGAAVFLATSPGSLFLMARIRASGGQGSAEIRKNRDQRAYRCPD